MNRTGTIGIGLALLFGLGLFLFIYGSPQAEAPPGVVAFAQCLASRGVTMYGAAWCPHCQNEKKAFGSAFKYVPYVECPDDPQTCIAKGIEGYPTWILPGGKKLVGEQGLAGLSKETGCVLVDTRQ